MKKIFIDFKNNLSESFKFEKGGYSARKLTSAATMLMVIVAHVVWIKHCFQKEDFSLLTQVLLIDYGFIAALLGMTTYSQNQMNKNKKEDESPKAE